MLLLLKRRLYNTLDSGVNNILYHGRLVGVGKSYCDMCRYALINYASIILRKMGT